MTETNTDATPENTSLRDELAKAFASYGEASQAVEPDAEIPDPEAEAETEVEAQSEGEEEAVEAEEAEAEEKLPEGPTWLPKEDRELFAKAPEPVREAWERNFKALQGNYTRATQELKEKGEKLSRFDRVLAPYRSMIAQAGADEAQAVQYLLSYYQSLVTNPKETLQRIAQSVGLSVDTGNAQETFNSGLDDPRIKTLEQKIGQLQAVLTASQRRQVQTEEQKINQQLAEFSGAKDKDGAPLHPHFEKLQTEMIPFVSQGLTLAQAYEKALWADEELREQLIAERAKALKKPPVKKATTKPKASGSGTVVQKALSEMSLRDELVARYNEAQKRAS